MLTISPPAVLGGAQLPRVDSGPDWVSTAGDEAVELARAAGLSLDPWQEYAVRRILAERVDGKWAAFESALLVARQNGKGGVLEALELAGLFVLGERLILHSAHEFKTASEAFLRVKTLIDGMDELRKRVARVRTSHGEEGFELLSGQRLRFVARSRSSGRGFSADRAILDEAQELPVSAMAALLPTLSARENPQVVYTGTVPAPENDSEHWTSVRDRGRTGGDPSLLWLEWSPGEDWADLDDRSAWAASNPALGYRLSEETIARERVSLSDDAFARERLSIWPDGTGSGPVDLDRWAGLVDPGDQRPSPVAFAVEVSPDRKWSGVYLAGRRADGRLWLQPVESNRGTGWVPGRVAELVAKWQPVGVALRHGSPGLSLRSTLAEAGVEATVVGQSEMGAACGRLVDLVEDDGLRHDGSGLLEVSLRNVRKRVSGESWTWAPSGSVDVSPLQGVTAALFLLEREASKPQTRRSGVVV